MKDILSSLETEYGFAVLGASGRRIDTGRVAGLFRRALERQQPWLPATEGGWFLGNGARLYWDAGAHPEYAAPECAGHPKHLVAHVRAGHMILRRIAAEMEHDRRIRQVRVWRGNIDYLSGFSWGCHENYLTQHSAARLGPNLIPHLVSRVIYGGAGGFSPHDQQQFSLSPRLELFQVTQSRDTMCERGIINFRNEPHARAHRRLHLISRDSVISQLGDLLSVGMTRLVVALADLGLNPASGLELDDPVAALHAFCADTRCRVEVPTSLGPMTAIDIQRSYLEQIAAHAAQLPDWSAEIVERCARVLDTLADDPRQLFGQLDWPTKLVLFERASGRGPETLLMLDAMVSDLNDTLLPRIFARGGGDVLAQSAIEAAAVDAPDGTRASVRGRAIKELSGQQQALCNWAEVRTPEKRLVLDEPFATRARWRRVNLPRM